MRNHWGWTSVVGTALAAFLTAACNGGQESNADGGGGAASTGWTSSSHKAVSHASTVGEGGSGGELPNTPQTPAAEIASLFGPVYRGAQFYLQSFGSSSPSGNPITYQWSQIAGAHVDLPDPTASQEVVMAPDVLGPLTFQLVVYDGPFASLPAKLTVIVEDRIPIAHAGHDQGGLAGSALTLAGSATDDDNDALTYSWTQVSGTPLALNDATLAQPTLMLPSDLSGPVVFALTVNDGVEDSIPDWVTIERLLGPDSDGDLLEDTTEAALGTDPANPDTDADGIPDGWEVLGHEGVDYPALGCDALHRDLLVELHAQSYSMGSVLHTASPSPVVRSALESFYAGLPIDNPDGLPGIALHIVDDTPLDQSFVCPDIAAGDPDVDTKPLNFLYREAFHKAFACIGGGQSSAEIGGRQLFLWMLELDNDPTNDALEENAHYWYSIFIHEMGHNLGLHHGGFEDLNDKPNYPSAMNYEFIEGLGGPHTLQGADVAYSAGHIPDIDECALVEQSIFSGTPQNELTYLASYSPMGWTVATDGTVDWNADGTIATQPYVRNLRDPTNPADCHLLKDHDDFAEIASGMAATLPSDPSSMTPFALLQGPRQFQLVP